MRRSSVDKWFDSAKKGKDSGLTKLLDKRKSWDIDIRDGKFRSALFLVAKAGNVVGVEKLLNLGANPNRQSKFGTPAHAAAEEKHEDCLRLLISFGAQLGIRNHKGETVLDCAKRCLGDRRVEQLLKSTDDNIKFDKLAKHRSRKSAWDDTDSSDEVKEGVIAAPLPEVKFEEIDHDNDYVYAKGPHSLYIKGRLGHCHVTLKKYRRESSEGFLREQFVNEVRNLSELRHPNILLLTAACYGPLVDHLCMVFEPVERGFLHRLIHVEKEHLGEDIILDIARDVACGVLYMHQRGYIHCYLGSHSVVMSESYHAKICNFEYAQAVADDGSNSRPISHFEALYEWMAPEQLRGKAANKLSDVYGIGMLIWECVTRKRPFDDIDNFKQVMSNEDPRMNKVSSKWSQDIKVLIKDCIQPAETRPSSEQLFEWLDGLANSRLVNTRPSTTIIDDLLTLFPKMKVKLENATQKRKSDH